MCVICTEAVYRADGSEESPQAPVTYYNIYVTVTLTDGETVFSHLSRHTSSRSPRRREEMLRALSNMLDSHQTNGPRFARLGCIQQISRESNRITLAVVAET